MARDRAGASWEQYRLVGDASHRAELDVDRQRAALRALATLSRGNAVLVRAHAEADLLQRMCDVIATTGEYPLVWYGRPARRRRPDRRSRSRSPERSRPTSTTSSCRGVRVPSASGPAARRSARGAPRCARTSRPTRTSRPGSTASAPTGSTCSVALPVLVGDEVDGVLSVYAAEPHSFDALAQTLLEDLVADLGFGLERLRDAALLRRSSSEAAAAAARPARHDRQPHRPVRPAGVGTRRVRRAGRPALRRGEPRGGGLQPPASGGAHRRHDARAFPGLLERGPLAAYFAAIETGEPDGARRRALLQRDPRRGPRATTSEE